MKLISYVILKTKRLEIQVDRHKVMFFSLVLSCLSCVRLFVILWTVDCKLPLSVVFSEHEYWSGLPFSPPGDFPNSGTEPVSLLMSPALTGWFFITSTNVYIHKKIGTIKKLLL